MAHMPRARQPRGGRRLLLEPLRGYAYAAPLSRRSHRPKTKRETRKVPIGSSSEGEGDAA